MSGRCNQHTRRDALKTVPATTPGGAIRSSIQGPAFFLQPCTPHPPPSPPVLSFKFYREQGSAIPLLVDFSSSVVYLPRAWGVSTGTKQFSFVFLFQIRFL